MIIYIHGFNSSGDNDKTKFLRDNLNIDVYAPTYPSNDPDAAIKIISDLIDKHKDDYDELMLIGSSLGGFYAQYLGQKYDAKVVLINPSLLAPDSLSKYVGTNTNYNTGETYTLTSADVDKLAKYSTPCHNNAGTLLLLDKGDDVIDYKIAVTLYKDNADIHAYSGGGHRFDHMNEALPLIERFYAAMWG